MAKPEWNPDRLVDLLLQEQEKLLTYKKLSIIERETMVALLGEVIFTLLDADDPPTGNRLSIEENFLQVLRDTLAERKRYRRKNGIRGANLAFTEMTGIELERAEEAGNVVTMPSPKNTDPKEE